MKKLFRHGGPGILLILGFSISCFIIMYGVTILGNVKTEDLILNRFSYKIEEMYDPSIVEESEMEYEELVWKILSIADEVNYGNISFIAYPHINNRCDRFETHIIYKQNEDAKLKIQKKVSSDSGIYIGENLEKYMNESDTMKDIEIDGTLFEVGGVLNNYMASRVDNSIYIIWDECEESLKAALIKAISSYMEEGFLKIVFESDENLADTVDYFSSELERISVHDMGTVKIYDGDYQNYWYKFYNYIFIVICLFFSVINCFCVSIIWIRRRQREITIRMAYGYSDMDILVMLYKDMMMLCIPAMLLALIDIMVFSTVLGIEGIFSHLFMKFILVVLGMLLIAVLCILYIVRKMGQRNIVESL